MNDQQSLSEGDNLYFGARAQIWASLYQEAFDYSAEAGAVLQALEVGGRGESILELGCGPGFLAIELARKGCVVTATDRSSQMLSVARSNARQAGVSSIAFHATTSLEGIEGQFAGVVAQRMAPNEGELRDVMIRVRRLLAPGARVLLSFWDPASKPSWLRGTHHLTVDHAITADKTTLLRVSDWLEKEGRHRWMYLDLQCAKSGKLLADAHMLTLPHIGVKIVSDMARSLGFGFVGRAPEGTAATVILAA